MYVYLKETWIIYYIGKLTYFLHDDFHYLLLSFPSTISSEHHGLIIYMSMRCLLEMPTILAIPL